MSEIFKGKGIPLCLLQILLGGICLGASVPEELSLDGALKKAYANNRTIQQKRLALSTAKLNYDDSWDLMFLPTVALQMTSKSELTMGRLPFGNSAATQAGDASGAHGFPTSSVALNLGQYTLFNFWKDQIVFEQAKLNYEREKERLNEVERQVRFQITNEYFRLKTEQDKLDASRRSVGISEAIVNLVKSRVRIGKATETDVASSNVDLLNAKNQFNAQVASVSTEQRNLNILLADPIDSVYLLKTGLQYAPLRIGYEDALKIYYENAPTMKDQRLTLKIGDYALELAEKNRLPLPTVTISGVAVTYNSSYYADNNTPGTTASTSGNIDLGAALSLTLPLYGPGGMFNGRNVTRARITRDLNEVNYQLVAATDQGTITTDIVQIRNAEVTIKNQTEAFKQNAQVLDSLFGEMNKREVNRLELRDAISSARQSDLDLKDAVLNHLSTKLGLAQLLGVDHLPGDPY